MKISNPSKSSNPDLGGGLRRPGTLESVRTVRTVRTVRLFWTVRLDYPDPLPPPRGGGGAGFLGIVTIGPSGWIMKGAGRRISRTPKTLKKHCLEQLLRISKFTFGKRYKTNGKLMLFGPKSENGLQKDQKSIRFFTIN